MKQELTEKEYLCQGFDIKEVALIQRHDSLVDKIHRGASAATSRRLAEIAELARRLGL